jgi:GNAT superfamily N-acetyltransferase
MVLDLRMLRSADLGPPRLEIREVCDGETLDCWRQAVHRGFGWPEYEAADIADNLNHFFQAERERPFAAYVALIDGEPVASSLAFFDAGIAGIYYVSTVPEQRRRGLGAVITATALIEARRRECTAAILHATEMGYPVCRRLGFEEVCAIEMHLRLWETSAR